MLHCLKICYFPFIFIIYYINLSLSIISSLFSGYIYIYIYIYIYFGISIALSSVCQLVSGLSHDAVLVLSSAILLSVKSLVAFTVFWLGLLQAVFSASVANFLAWSRDFWVHLPFNSSLAFFTWIFPIFSAKIE